MIFLSVLRVGTCKGVVISISHSIERVHARYFCLGPVVITTTSTKGGGSLGESRAILPWKNLEAHISL